MARKTVLDAVRDALADAVVPPLPRLARASAAPDRHVLAARFAREAGTVGTIVHEVEGLGTAISAVAAVLAATATSPRVVAWPTPLARTVATAAVAATPGASLHIVDDAATAPGRDPADDLAAVRAATTDVIAAADVGITEAEYLVADSGTLVLRAAGRARGVSLLPPVHVAVVACDRLVADLGAALAHLRATGARDSCVTLVTGPSRTADIEKKLVVGVHGPCTLHVVLLAPPEA